MTPSQRQLSATIAKSIESMSVADASKTLRQGVVNLLDEYLRVTPANHAVLITSTGAQGTGAADVSLLLNDAVPQHIADGILEHAEHIKTLLTQASADSAPSTEIAPPEVVDVKPQTSPDELHGSIRADQLDGAAKAAPVSAPSHTMEASDPMATSPTPSVDSLGGPLRAIQPAHDNASNTLVAPPPLPVAVPVTALVGEGVSPLPLGPRSGKGARMARASDENMPTGDRMHRIAYVLPYSDNNVNGVDDGYR